MEGTVDAGREAVSSIVSKALETAQAKDECLRLARYCVRLELVLVELQLLQRSNEALRGSKTVFLAIDATVSALRQAEQLVTQCAATNPSSIWPLEDAVEFQGVAAELRSAAAGLAALGGRLSADVQLDASHVYQQLMGLSFTEDELSETEELELEHVQHLNSTNNTPRHPAAAAAAAAGAAAAVPPAAPPDQFTSPGAALDSGAVSVSEAAAAAARCPPPPSPDRIQQVHQREVLAEAAAVAHDAVADVLPPEDQDQGPEEGQEPGESDAQLLQEIREEAAEAAAAAGAPVVLTSEGETALGPEVPAKGAVPSRGGTPLPRDPFDMTGEPEGLGNNTLQELRTFQQGQEDLAVADEAQRQLEASADNLSLQEQQARAAGGTEAQALAALKQLHEYESAMEAGEAAEEAAEEAGAGGQAAPSAGEEPGAGGAAEAPQPPLHKSRSQAAAAVLDRNLAELASEWLGGGQGLEPAGDEQAAEPAAPHAEE